MGYTGKVKKTLKEYFEYNSFLVGQEGVIQSILEGRDTIAIFPTGGGKSLCYQLPALIFPVPLLLFHPLYPL